MERWRRYRHPQVYQQRIRPSGPTWPVRWPNQRTLRGLVACGLVFATIWLVTGSAVFAVTDVQLAGEVTPAVAERANQWRGTNMFLLRERRLVSSLRAVDPALADVQVVRGLPRRLHIQLTRRHPSLLWQSGETTWAIDATGVAFPLDATTAAGVPVVIDLRALAVKPGESLLAPSFVQFVADAAPAVAGVTGGPIAQVEVQETTFHIRVVTAGGWRLLLDTNRSLAVQLDELALILTNQPAAVHEYVDLRIPGSAYIK